MKSLQRGRIYQSLYAGQGRRDLSCSQQQSTGNVLCRQVQQYCTQRAGNKGGKAESPLHVENALCEILRPRSPTAIVTAARTPGWSTQDIRTTDGTEGRSVTGISFTAFFHCSSQSPCLPSHEFFACRSISHHKQTHKATLILVYHPC